jgi:hypothetical protein
MDRPIPNILESNKEETPAIKVSKGAPRKEPVEYRSLAMVVIWGKETGKIRKIGTHRYRKCSERVESSVSGLKETVASRL